jgi:hypothetical protein
MKKIRDPESQEPSTGIQFLFGDILKECIKTVDMDWNGHWENGEYFDNEEAWKERIDFLFLCIKRNVSIEQITSLVQAIQTGKPTEWVSLGSLTSFDCTNCDKNVEILFNGVNMRMATACPYPNGHYPFSVELNVPSGKMFFENDLRDLFSIVGGYNVNSSLGLVKTTEAYEKVGMAHGFTGNSCPAILQSDGQHLNISLPPDMEKKWDNELAKEVDLTPEEKQELEKVNPPGEKIGWICTDLWWYSCVDYDELKRRYLIDGGDEEKFEQQQKHATIANVKPGVYKFTHYDRKHWDVWGDDKVENPRTIVDIEWVRDSDLQPDYLEIEKGKNYTAGQICYNAIRSWPTLHFCKDMPTFDFEYKKGDLEKEIKAIENCIKHNKTKEALEDLSMEEFKAEWEQLTDEEKMKSFAAAAQQEFFHTRTWDWHENGWVSSDVEITPDEPDPPIPVFKGQLFGSHWLSPGAPICAAAGMYRSWNELTEPLYLNESHAELAYNILQNVIRYGSRLSEDRDPERQKWNEQAVQETKKHAYETFHRLSQMKRGDVLQYPVPEFCQDLLGQEVPEQKIEQYPKCDCGAKIVFMISPYILGEGEIKQQYICESCGETFTEKEKEKRHTKQYDEECKRKREAEKKAEKKKKEEEKELEAKVGQPVIHNDDGFEYHGVIEKITPGKGQQATHYGNLYACRFTFDEGDGRTYTQNFDSRSLGRDKDAELRLHDTLHPDFEKKV